MSKKRDLKMYMVVVLDRKAVEKDSLKESMKGLKFSLDSLAYFVTDQFSVAIKRLKKTGQLRWPSKYPKSGKGHAK